MAGLRLPALHPSAKPARSGASPASVRIVGAPALIPPPRALEAARGEEPLQTGIYPP